MLSYRLLPGGQQCLSSGLEGPPGATSVSLPVPDVSKDIHLGEKVSHTKIPVVSEGVSGEQEVDAHPFVGR